MKVALFNLSMVIAVPVWLEQLSNGLKQNEESSERVVRSLGLNRTLSSSLDDLGDDLGGLNRSLNHTDIRYNSLSPYLQQTVDNYERNQFRAEAYGDPHFVIEQGDSKVCFDLYGDQNGEITLLADVRSGLRVWGKVKTRQESQTIVFEEIHVVTPKGAHIISTGSATQVSGTNSASGRVRDFELAQSENRVNLEISIGRQSKIKMAISTARHLTVSFNQLKQITNRVSGIVGEFYRQQFSIEAETTDNNGVFTLGAISCRLRSLKMVDAKIAGS